MFDCLSARCIREGKVNAPLALVRVYSSPDCLTGMFLLRQQVPVIARSFLGCCEDMPETELVLSAPAMPQQEGAFAPGPKVIPGRLLVFPGPPLERLALFDFALQYRLKFLQRGR